MDSTSTRKGTHFVRVLPGGQGLYLLAEVLLYYLSGCMLSHLVSKTRYHRDKSLVIICEMPFSEA